MQRLPASLLSQVHPPRAAAAHRKPRSKSHGREGIRMQRTASRSSAMSQDPGGHRWEWTGDHDGGSGSRRNHAFALEAGMREVHRSLLGIGAVELPLLEDTPFDIPFASVVADLALEHLRDNRGSLHLSLPVADDSSTNTQVRRDRARHRTLSLDLDASLDARSLDSIALHSNKSGAAPLVHVSKMPLGDLAALGLLADTHSVVAHVKVDKLSRRKGAQVSVLTKVVHAVESSDDAVAAAPLGVQEDSSDAESEGEELRRALVDEDELLYWRRIAGNGASLKTLLRAQLQSLPRSSVATVAPLLLLHTLTK